jgi:Ca2+-binding EF-hand superfamily protein
MGCGSSGPVAPRAGTAALSKRIQSSLQKKIAEDTTMKQLTLEKIVLKMEKSKQCLGIIKNIFKAYSEDGGKTLGKKGLATAMSRLQSSLADEAEIDELYRFIDIDISNAIEFREFLIALCVCNLLGKLTADGITTRDDGATVRAKSWVSNLSERRIECMQMLELIIVAYLLFDPKGRGLITMREVEKVLEEHSKNGGSHSDHFLSKQMWKEMDWDKSGAIDFAEFVWGFSKWTDFDLEEGEEES